MKYFVKRQVINIINILINSVLPDETLPQLSKEQQLGLFGQLYQNPTMRQYLNARETYLINAGMNSFIEEKLTNAKGYAGQLIEIRELRMRIKASHLTTEKLAKQKSVQSQNKQ